MPLPIDQLPEKIAKVIASSTIFVETGYGQGQGIIRALELGFEKIYSIEIDKVLYTNALNKFEKEVSTGQVVIILGDSSVELPKIVNRLKVPTTFWLDAHERRSQNFDVKCPLYKELETIKNHEIKDHVVMIDDYMQIRQSVNPWTKEVSGDEVKDKLQEVNEDFTVEEFAYTRRKKVNSIIMGYLK